MNDKKNLNTQVRNTSDWRRLEMQMQMQIFSVYGYSPPGEPLTDADKPEYSDWTHVRLEEAQMAKEHFEEVEKDYHV